MYCAKCGTEIGDSNFCPNCGLPMGALAVEIGKQDAVSIEFQQKNDRNALLARISEDIAYYRQDQPLYNQWNQASWAMREADRKNKMIWPIVLSACWLSCVVPLAFPFAFLPQGTDTFFVLLLVLVLPVVVVLFIHFFNKQKRRKRIAKYKQERDALWLSICQHYNAHPNNLVAFEYAKLDSLEMIAELIRLGRADSIKEALNIMRNDSQNEEILRMQQAIQNKNAKIANMVTVSAVADVAQLFRR